MAPRAAVQLMEDDGPSPEERAASEHERRSRMYTGLELVRADDKPYALTKSGIALVPVLGTLVQRGSWLDSMSGLTSYDMVASQLDRALSDSDVRAVMLEVDSPGGEASGLADLAERVYAGRAKKPMWAHANEQAYSAAYWLASSAARVYTPITGGVGSIGAVMLHVDQSKRDANMGLKYTFIHSGAHKVDGNSHEPMNKDALSWAQAEVDRMRQLFAQAVSTRRGLSTDAVLGTEAALLTPPQALEGGYVDGVMPLVQAVTLLEAELRAPGSTTSSSGTRTAGQPTKPTLEKEQSMKLATPAASAILAALSIAMDSVSDANGAKLESAIIQLTDPARAEAKAEGVKEGETSGRQAGVVAERARIGAILACEEAKGRGGLALHLALHTDTEAEAAKKLLAAAPKDAAGGTFAAAMASLGNPKVGADAGSEGAEQAGARLIERNLRSA
jgi:ClpP class serine protease